MRKLQWQPTIEQREFSHLIIIKVHIEEWINVLQFMVGCLAISNTGCTVVVKECTYQSTTEESYFVCIFINNVHKKINGSVSVFGSV